MKKRNSHILIMLLLGAMGVSTANAKTKSKHLSRSHSISHHSVAKNSVERKSITKSVTPSLYDAAQAEYVSTGKSLFDFGPQSKNIKYDKRMIEAAQIAAGRARAHSTSRCWHAVKNALVDAHLVSSRPTTEYAKEAGDELTRKFGFIKLPVRDPFAAPIGSVLVYGGRGAGHVEFRTAAGFVSDFTTNRPSRRPLLGVYIKQS